MYTIFQQDCVTSEDLEKIYLQLHYNRSFTLESLGEYYLFDFEEMTETTFSTSSNTIKQIRRRPVTKTFGTNAT